MAAAAATTAAPSSASFAFSNLVGSVYQTGNVLFTPDGASLISPVGNRVSLFHLLHNTSTTLPFELRKPVARIAQSPANPAILLVADVDGRAVLAHSQRRVVLAHINFKQPLRDAKFSHDGSYVAVTHGSQMQVWRVPNILTAASDFAPFVLHRTYVGHHNDILSITWSKDDQFILTTSKDLTARLYSLHPLQGFKPRTFAGHRDQILGAWFSADEREIYTVSRDGACFVWRSKDEGLEGWDEDGSDDDDDARDQDADGMDVDEDDDGGKGNAKAGSSKLASTLGGVRWGVASRHYFYQADARVTSVALHRSNAIGASALLVTGFSSGVFTLHELPSFTMIHSLSISSEKITSVAISPSGDWLAFGASRLGQLLVWEWASESYILKQQGHFFDMNTVAFSPDGGFAATGGDDGKVKLWNISSSFCTATFSDHSAPVSAIDFAKRGQVLFSASLDGTVRAYDLLRYRNFRTFTAPRPVQFGCVAVEPSGEVVCAGSTDSFEVYMWSVQTGRILDILSGHTGPVVGLAFDPQGSGMMASISWDRSIRLWETFGRSGNVEPFTLNADGLAIAFRPDGLEVCAATLDGQLAFFDAKTGKQTAVLDCRRDIAAGRKTNDKMSRRNAAAGAAFTSVTYSADGRRVLAGGNANFVCLYDVRERVLLKRWTISRNLAYDGTQDRLDSRRMTEAGPAELLDKADEELEELTARERLDRTLPGVQSGDASKRNTRLMARTKCVRFSPTGRSWAAASTAGLLIYSLDAASAGGPGAAFDPLELELDLTPASVRAASAEAEHVRALVGALKLGERALAAEVYERVPAQDIALVARQVPVAYLAPLLRLVAARMSPFTLNAGDPAAGTKKANAAASTSNAVALAVASGPANPSAAHFEFHLRWLAALLTSHGSGSLKPRANNEYAPVLREVQGALNELKANVRAVGDENVYSLLYVWNGMKQ
ncbi:U3 snoRNP protein [Tilletia horrida]|uniref:U3 snoRNP protein n=1 Tax=Tilletia horrida TaxID=155126 RepID=A0AAN6JI12_9BASI|nr:U3 snoRNP protein [Tilletia horrida]